MFYTTKTKGGDILLAQSKQLGQFIRDMVGKDGVRGFARKIGVSPSWAMSIMDGYVPNEDKLQRIAVVYELRSDLTKRLFDLAADTRPDLDTDSLIQVACDAVGFDANDRIEIMEHFRQIKERKSSKKSAA